MDYVNPADIFDHPFPLISPDLGPLSSPQSPSSGRSQWLLTSPQPSLFDAFPAVDSQNALDFTNIAKDGYEDFSPIGRTNVRQAIISDCLSPVEESLDQFYSTTIGSVQSFSPIQSFSEPQSSLPVTRRRSGRLTKVKLAMQSSRGKRSVSRSRVATRRQTHNDSAGRSRARLNDMLETLWSTIPTEQRIRSNSESGFHSDQAREISRAGKVEIAISYIRKMQKHFNSSFDEATLL